MSEVLSSLRAITSEESVQDLPLGVLYKCSQDIIQDLPSIFAAKDPEVNARCLQVLTTCERASDGAGLFSSNEEKDDIATGDLKYLLVSFYVAEYHANAPSTGPAQRLASVNAALSGYQNFLERCQHYGLLGDLGARIHEYQEQGRLSDPNIKRLVKIDKFKRSKELNLKVEELEENKRQAAEQDAQETGPLGGARGTDEEDERKLWFLKIELAVLQSLEQTNLLKDEVAILQHSLNLKASASGSRETNPQQAVAQDQILQQLRSIAGQLDGGRKEHLRQQVFQPGHILPTMTVEQFGRLEMEDAMRRQAAEQAAASAAARSKAESRSDDEDEQEVAHQRYWDDFKDDNPRGAGNSKLKPCG